MLSSPQEVSSLKTKQQQYCALFHESSAQWLRFSASLASWLRSQSQVDVARGFSAMEHNTAQHSMASAMSLGEHRHYTIFGAIAWLQARHSCAPAVGLSPPHRIKAPRQQVMAHGHVSACQGFRNKILIVTNEPVWRIGEEERRRRKRRSRRWLRWKTIPGAVHGQQGQTVVGHQGERDAPCAHRACIVHLFYLNNVPHTYCMHM